MDLDLGCVASYLVVIEEGHYGRAAARLHLTPSALSKRIRRLEHQVGVSLLVRNEGGVAGPTAAGARFAAQAHPLLAAARAAKAAALADQALLTVRVGVFDVVGEIPNRHQLAEANRRLREHYPGVRLVRLHVPFSEMYSCLLDGTVDVVAWPISTNAPASVDLTFLGGRERVGIVAASHDLADAEQVPAVQFAQLRLLYNASMPTEWMSPFYLGDLRPSREAHLLPLHRTDTASVLARVKEGGVATTLLRGSTLGTGFRTVRLSDVPPVPFFLARRRSDRREAVRTLVDILPRIAAGAALEG
jgi:DNA-binding transcriptional LysR family regulator